MVENAERRAQLEEALDKILTVLLYQYDAERVFLFGALAENAVDEWSDLGVAVVKETDKPFIQRLKEVALLCQSPVGVDFLVYTPAEFDRMVAEENPFILETIIQKGKVLYERRSSAQAVA